ncbi:uncharacterized protein LOC142828104 isoform X2 [Pelodiscus sinensis]|uniref:uncharacterized protein LOC142828104 isoform X2 n=1 Tax=Pelodiscus sinensis TaxID=13735 RepID=UPI003F6C06CD
MSGRWPGSPRGSGDRSPGSGAGAAEPSGGGANSESVRPAGQDAETESVRPGGQDAETESVRPAGQGAEAETCRGPAQWDCGEETPPASPGSESASSAGRCLGAASGERAGLGSGAEPGDPVGPGPEAHSFAAQGHDADPRGVVLMAWLLSVFGRGTEAAGRRDRPGEEPDTQEAAGMALEIRRTVERLQAQLEALKGSSNPETLEFLQTLEAPLRVASGMLTENQRLRREVEELKGRLAAPSPLEPASLPPAPCTSPPWATQRTALPLQVRVSGKTAGCERQFLDQLAQLLAAQGISLQPGAYKPHSSHPLLLFCPVSSRPGTDISNALEGIPAARRALLVVLHHQPNERAELYANSQREARHAGLLGAVDGCFSTQSGFYPCQANTAALASAAATLRRLALGGC